MVPNMADLLMQTPIEIACLQKGRQPELKLSALRLFSLLQPKVNQCWDTKLESRM